MHKIVCLALRHRFRVVQEFGPSQRRLKCERCGGDWGMNDAMRMIVHWDPDLQQLYRDFGFEILEPLPDPTAALEPLTLPELLRAVRWTGAIAITLSSIAGYAIEVAGFRTVGLIALFAVSFGTARLLGQRAIERAYERKRNSLQA